MRLIYLKPQLKDLTIESRIAFARQFRKMTQDEVLEKLGLDGKSKRGNITRYEKGDRNPKDDRTLEISKILNASFNATKNISYW